MAWLSAASHSAVMSNITSIENIYQSVKGGMQSSFGSAFSAQPDDHWRFAFCNILAWDLKPYIGSNATRLKELMQEDGLDCDNYVRLAWHFFNIMRPSSTSEVAAVGWEGGTMGNHAQMQISTSGHPSMYCDPTIGLVVNAFNFDHLCKGTPVTAANMHSLNHFNPRTETVSLNTNVQSAFSSGSIRASQLLYVYTDLKRYDTAARQYLGTYPVRNG